jgi:hypothetical protein
MDAAPSSMPYAVLALIFIIGTLLVGLSAARTSASRPYVTAILAGCVFEALLLSFVRPGLSLLAATIAFGSAALVALLGAWIGCRLVRR